MGTKVISVPEHVDDLYGLYIDLRKSEFLVKNVGADQRGTYVHLDSAETKDPAPVVESWVGRPSPELNQALKKRRTKEMEEVIDTEHKSEEARLEEEAQKAAEADAKMIDPNVPFEDGIGEVEEEAEKPAGKDSFIKKVWKKLF